MSTYELGDGHKQFCGADGSVVIVLAGEIDAFTGAEFATLLEELAGSGSGDIVIDLAGVVFLDSWVIGRLLDAERSLARAGRRLVIDSPSMPIYRLFEMIGLGRQLIIDRRG